jgi:hypothetical protein
MAKQGSVKDEPRQAGGFGSATYDPAVGRARRSHIFYNRTVDKLLILLLPLTWFTYYSWQPAFELKTQPPPQFVDAPAGATAATRAREQTLAQAYWEVARTNIRWRYAHGAPLPSDPPPEFRLNQDGAVPSTPEPPLSPRAEARSRKTVDPTDAPASRLRYWRKLQDVWLQPYAWRTEREWGTAWFTDPFVWIYVNVQDYLSNRVRAL